MNDYNLAFICAPYSNHYSEEKPNFFVYRSNLNTLIDIKNMDDTEHAMADFFFMIHSSPRDLVQKHFKSTERLGDICDYITERAGSSQIIRSHYQPNVMKGNISHDFACLTFRSQKLAEIASNKLTEGLSFSIPKKIAVA